MQLAYRGCSYHQIPPSARILKLFSSANLRRGMYRGVPYQFYRVPEIAFKEKFQIKYRGTAVKTETIDLDRDLIVAKIQIQNTIGGLTESGMSSDEAIDEVARQIITLVRLNPHKKTDLVRWGQTIGSLELSEPVKKTVNRAMIAVSS
jgi:uncharacterized protein YoaH (UPF0181 family)